VDFPTPTPLYDAVAAALRPYVDETEHVALTFPKVVALAAEAAQTVLDANHAEVAALVTERRRAVADALDSGERARAEGLTAVTEAERTVGANEEELANLRAELGRRSQRSAVLEGFYVLARARWDYEGAPPVMRQAIDAVAATP